MNRRFLLVAVLLAGLSFALAYAKLSSNDSGGSSSPAAGSQPVVVAKVPIKQRTLITPEMLEVKNVPLNAISTGAISTLEAASGKVTKFPIEINQQVVSAAIVDTSAPITAPALSYVVPTGKRAMSIQASQVSMAGGLILPGDYVDLIWGCCSDRPVVVSTLLRNVQVAAVAQVIVNSGPTGEDGAAPVQAETGAPQPDAVSLTLLLTPQETQLLFLAESTGKIRADLRGIGDETVADTGFNLLTDILPLDIVERLPEELRPEGYKDPAAAAAQ
ncbi:MAG: Flp pilus assembly protein CpaB [Dehalococcoidia bacterium]